MSVSELINSDIIVAMKAKDKVRLEALRSVKKELIEARTAKGAADEMTDSDALLVIKKLVKQRKDSAALFIEQGRQDLAEVELAEMEAIIGYLPVQMSAEEIAVVVKRLVEELGVTSIKEMGKVMSAASSELAGKADGKEISLAVKALLS